MDKTKYVLEEMYPQFLLKRQVVEEKFLENFETGLVIKFHIILPILKKKGKCVWRKIMPSYEKTARVEKCNCEE